MDFILKKPMQEVPMPKVPMPEVTPQSSEEEKVTSKSESEGRSRTWYSYLLWALITALALSFFGGSSPFDPTNDNYSNGSGPSDDPLDIIYNNNPPYPSDEPLDQILTDNPDGGSIHSDVPSQPCGSTGLYVPREPVTTLDPGPSTSQVSDPLSQGRCVQQGGMVIIPQCVLQSDLRERCPGEWASKVIQKTINASTGVIRGSSADVTAEADVSSSAYVTADADVTSEPDESINMILRGKAIEEPLPEDDSIC